MTPHEIKQAMAEAVQNVITSIEENDRVKYAAARVADRKNRKATGQRRWQERYELIVDRSHDYNSKPQADVYVEGSPCKAQVRYANVWNAPSQRYVNHYTIQVITGDSDTGFVYDDDGVRRFKEIGSAIETAVVIVMGAAYHDTTTDPVKRPGRK